MTTNKLLVPLTLVLVGCGSVEPIELVVVSGTVTNGGQPVTEEAVVSIGVIGRSDPVHIIVGILDGTYAIGSAVESSDCSSLFVRVVLQNMMELVIAEATESLGSCGTHVVDLVLSPP